MDFTVGDSIALISVVLSALALIIGLPAAIYSVKKQVAEAKSLLATEAQTYSKAAQQAVESQGFLQTQINELRAQLESRDALIEELQKEIGKRDTRILDQDDQIQRQAKEIAQLQSEVEELRNK
jgi:peptidoglycan hydrolase CwlO-like protein